ncbi:sugar phosphate isomerase/epimerase family protein [Chitinilyticum litopenaei]|uniref:sugar phosphate isomerase/epimerase family protein n=1 Tax=Chitinilyticum litopenaei TaxID=1121276 RepID=UPI000405D532|nr:TIM barrel protein [Chitinilyticum litopenaei]
MTGILGCTTRPYQQLAFPAACAAIAAAGISELAVYYSARPGGPDAIVLHSGSTQSEVAQVRAVAADAGLRPSMLLGGWHPEAGLPAAISDYCRLIDVAAALGVRWLLDCGCDEPALRADYIVLMQAVLPHAAQAGIGITLKPHGGIALGPADLLALHAAIAHPAFSLCFDPGNFLYYSQGAIRPETCAAQLAPYCSSAIIKDCTLTAAGPDVMITPGEGLVDFPRVLGDLVQHGFAGPCYLECVGGQSLPVIDANVRASRQLALGWLARATTGDR